MKYLSNVAIGLWLFLSMLGSYVLAALVVLPPMVVIAIPFLLGFAAMALLLEAGAVLVVVGWTLTLLAGLIFTGSTRWLKYWNFKGKGAKLEKVFDTFMEVCAAPVDWIEPTLNRIISYGERQRKRLIRNGDFRAA